MNERNCGVDGCPKPYYAKGFCLKHRERVRLGASVESLRPVRPKIDNLARNEHGQKQCSGCREWFDLDRFTISRSARDGFNQRCRDCCALQKLLTRYRMTLAGYQDLLATQGGLCAICGKGNQGKAFCVDHDHRCCPTGQSCGACIRGLLCGACNRAIGLLNDDVTTLRNAVDYLERGRNG